MLHSVKQKPASSPLFPLNSPPPLPLSSTTPCLSMLIWLQAEVEVAPTWLISGRDMDGRSCLVLRNNKHSLAFCATPTR